MNKPSRLFSFKEHISNVFTAGISFVRIRQLKRRNKSVMNKKLKERIMLAVSEVNGCAMCSYVHTKLALQVGIDNEEIKNIIKGDIEGIPEEDVPAVLFAKNFAFNHEVIDPALYNKIAELYGEDKANAIIHVCNIITMTCAMGINLKLLKNRILLKPGKGSKFFNEIMIPLSTIVLFPVAIIAGLFN
jgi:AhpD family alkylhydroperoxidase